MIPTGRSRLRTTADRRWLPLALLTWALALVAAWSIFARQRPEAPPENGFVLRIHVDDTCGLSDDALHTLRSGLDRYGDRMWVETLIADDRTLDPAETKLVEQLQKLPRTQVERIGDGPRRRGDGGRCWERIGT